MTTENVKKPNKKAAVITYLIALVAIIGGWFIPLFGDSSLALIDRMTFWYLPAMVNEAFGATLIPASIVTHVLPEFCTMPLPLFGMFNFDIVCILYVGYAIVTVLALIMLIPVLAGKKTKRTSSVCAYIVEVFAVLFLIAILISSATHYKYFEGSEYYYTTAIYNLPVLIISSVLYIILFIQSIINKKGLGVLKTFSFLLTALSLVSLFDIVGVITHFFGNGVETILNNLLGAINSNLSFAPVAALNSVQTSAIASYYYLNYPSELVSYITSSTVGMGDKVLLIAITATMVFTLLNIVFDTIGLATGKKYNKDNLENPRKAAKVFSFIRYQLALAAAITAIVTTFVIGLTVGVYLYLYTLFSLILHIISIVRLCRVKSLKKAIAQCENDKLTLDGSDLATEKTVETQIVSDAEVAAPVEEQTEVITEEVVLPCQPVEEVSATQVSKPVATINTVTEEVVQEGEQLTIPVDDGATSAEAPTQKIIYNVQTVYNGPTDEFMDTLTDEEKVEFTKVFLNKTKGKLPADLPEYEIGGNNDEFFPVIFIYLGKFRSMLTRGLLLKIYKQLTGK